MTIETNDHFISYYKGWKILIKISLLWMSQISAFVNIKFW